MAANEAFSDVLGRAEVWELMKALYKSSILLWVKVFSVNMHLYTQTCLILTHSVYPGSLSCQSHPSCLWKHYSKWNAQATGCGPFSTGVGLVGLLAEPKHWVAAGREDYLVQLEMKTQHFCLCKVNTVTQFGFF